MGQQRSHIALDYDNHLAAKFFAQLLADFSPDVVHFFHLSRLGTGLIEAAVHAQIPAFFTPTDFWSVCPTAQLLLHDGTICSGPSPSGGNCVQHITQNSTVKGIAALANAVPIKVFDWISLATGSGFAPPYPRKIEIAAIGARLPTNVERLNKLNAIVAPNQLMCDLLARHGVQRHRIAVKAYGVESTESAARSFPVFAERLPLRIGFIGTLAQHKGCHVLIDAYKLLSSGVATLKIYGSLSDFPDYAAKLKQTAGDCGDIAFYGTFENEDISEVLGEIDVLVVPSLWVENTPLVVYSAQASSCPVIASDFSGISEVIRHNVNGLVFEAGNSQALAQQLQRLVAEPELLPQLSANAQQPKSAAQYVDDIMALWLEEKIGSRNQSSQGALVAVP
jgi:glycosyltransferase involved in cell wall biosynthesis